MEPLAKRPRLDTGFAGNGTESSTTGQNSQRYQHLDSSLFRGSGVQAQHSNIDIGRDFNVTVTNSTATEGTQQSHRQSLLESLHFEQLEARQQSIKRAHAKTCRWFLATEEYKKWKVLDPLQNDDKFLWVRGKPGAGKSTLMKFLLGQVRSQIGTSHSKIVISFFFNARGGDLEKSTIGLYRSLLWQLFDARPEIQHVLDRIRPTDQWNVEFLQELFSQVLEQIEDTPVVCLVDALDECGRDEVRNMVGFLDELVQGGSRLHVCLASRHYPHITINTKLSMILEGRDEHQADIVNYLSTKFTHVGDSELAEQLRMEIGQKACGIFMWVVLVVDILVKEYDAGHKHKMLLPDRLRQFPSDLHQLFAEILTRDYDHQPGLLLCIQWILFAKQPLTPKQLYLAILSGTEPAHLVDCHSVKISDHDIQKFILDKSKGLAEPTRSKSPTVQFIHESVNDFLTKHKGLSKVFPDVSANFVGLSHDALKFCCLSYLNMDGFTGLETTSVDTVELNFPFLQYAINGLLHHANQAAHNRIDQSFFLEKLPLARWIKHYNAVQKHKTRHYTTGASLLYILAEANAPALIRAHQPRQSCFTVENERYGLPVLAASVSRCSSTILTMLELESESTRLIDFSFANFCREFCPTGDIAFHSSRKFTFTRKIDIFPQLILHGDEITSSFYLQTKAVDVNQTSSRDKRKTLLMYAAEAGHSLLIADLLRRGADASINDHDGNTALYYALWNGRESAAKLLIQAGPRLAHDLDGQGMLRQAITQRRNAIIEVLLNTYVDVLARDKDGSTPLHFTAFYENTEAARILISNGAHVSAVDNEGRTPLHKALWAGCKLDIIQALIEKGADVSAVDNEGRTPLHKALWAGCKLDIIQALIEKGADVSAVDNEGRTPLHKALYAWCQLDIIQILIEKGADVSAVDNEGQTPLHTITSPEVIRLLIGNGQTPRQLIIQDKPHCIQ